MPYKYKTPIFNLPYMGKEDILSEQEERRRAIIIENQLLAANKGIKNCIFEEGEYRVLDKGKTRDVCLLTTGENISFMGIVNSAFCKTCKTIIWNNLIPNRIYYLYLKAKDNIYENCSSVLSIAKESTPYYDEHNATLLAKIKIGYDSYDLDINPDGKIYGQDILVHSSDTTNPHGENLVQDNLLIRKSLNFEQNGIDGLSKEIVNLYDENGNGILQKEKFITLNELSNGTEGREIICDSKIKSIIVYENVVENKPTFGLGEIAIKIFDNRAYIYNNGKCNIPILITIVKES